MLDEPTSALDVLVEAQILNQLTGLQDRLGVTYLFISHGLAVIRYMCDRLAVIQQGVTVKQGEAEAVFARPQSSYARDLPAAMPGLPRAGLN